VDLRLSRDLVDGGARRPPGPARRVVPFVRQLVVLCGRPAGQPAMSLHISKMSGRARARSTLVQRTIGRRRRRRRRPVT